MAQSGSLNVDTWLPIDDTLTIEQYKRFRDVEAPKLKVRRAKKAVAK